MADLDKLIVRIEADLSDLKRGMAQANNEVNKVSSNFDNQFNKINQGLDKAGATFLKFGAIIGGAVTGVAVKGFIDVGMSIENLQVRLEALFGSAQEGALAFEEMVNFASKVPFTLEQIQQGSGSLAVVSKDSEELAKLLEVTGNVASVTGLDFRTASEQIQRSFAGGIASADLFRERGVRAMLGFEQGATVSIEETQKRFFEVFGAGGKFGQASDELAKTLSGTLSMLGDKFFKFQTSVVDSFFTEFKQSLVDLNTSLDENATTIQAVGNIIGEGLAGAIRTFKNALDEIAIALKIFASLIVGAFAVGRVLAMIEAFAKLRKEMLKLNITTALTSGSFLGLIGRIGAGVIAFAGLEKGIELLNKKIEETERKIEEQEKRFKAVSNVYDLTTGKVKELKKAQDDLAKSTDKVNFELEQAIKHATKHQKALDSSQEAMEDFIEKQKDLADVLEEEVSRALERTGEAISEAFARAVVKGEDFGEAMKNIFQQLLIEIVKVTVQILVMDKLMEALKRKLNEIKDSSTGTASLIGSIGSMSFAPSPSVMSSPTFIPSLAGGSAGGGGVTVNQSLNVSTGVNQTVRAEIQNMMPEIKQETIGAVAEARARGGSFARTFGA